MNEINANALDVLNITSGNAGNKSVYLSPSLDVVNFSNGTIGTINDLLVISGPFDPFEFDEDNVTSKM